MADVVFHKVTSYASSSSLYTGGATVFAAAGLPHVTDELVKEKGRPLWDLVKVCLVLSTTTSVTSQLDRFSSHHM